jgi:SpoIID/LytB domain protein
MSRKHGAAVVTVVAVAGMLLGVAPARAAGTVVFTGGGWGHGLGMSQYGALGRAQAGWSASEILKHYYSGTRVGRFQSPAQVRVGLQQHRAGFEMTSVATRAGGGEVVLKVLGRSWEIARAGAGASWEVRGTRTGRMRVLLDGARVRRRGRSAFGGLTRPLVALYQRRGTQLRVADGDADRGYRHGRMILGTYATATCNDRPCLRLVLSISLQKYLLGLGEVPLWWPLEALKAQVIAARTYAVRTIGLSGQRRLPCDCALADDATDQVYAGDDKRAASGAYWAQWVEAVRATDERVITYDGAPIQAFYSSSSGGHTENNENVWGGAAIPYLRGVPDGFDDNAANPNHTWEESMAWEEVSSRLDAAFGTGELDSFRVVKPLGVSGRVTVVKSASQGGVEIVGSARTVRASGLSVQRALGLKDTLFRIDVRPSAPEVFGAAERVREIPSLWMSQP